MVALVVALLVVFGAGSAAPVGADDAMSTLTVTGRGPKTGYDREQFGSAWTDVDRNGCDTRNDVLNRDLGAKEWRQIGRSHV